MGYSPWGHKEADMTAQNTATTRERVKERDISQVFLKWDTELQKPQRYFLQVDLSYAEGAVALTGWVTDASSLCTHSTLPEHLHRLSLACGMTFKRACSGTSLGVQRLRSHAPSQGAQV